MRSTIPGGLMTLGRHIIECGHRHPEATGTGDRCVLDEPIASIHQRVPLAIGSRAEIERYEDFVRTSGGRTSCRLD